MGESGGAREAEGLDEIQRLTGDTTSGHGFGSAAFQEVLGQQSTLLNLAPVVEAQWPSHVMWYRH